MELEMEAIRGTGSEVAGDRARCLTQPYARCLQVMQEAGDNASVNGIEGAPALPPGGAHRGDASQLLGQ